jgi:integrase
MKTLERVKYGERGDGYLVKRKESDFWHSVLFVGGREHVESTSTDDLKAAKTFHKRRLDRKSADRQGLKTFDTVAKKRTRVGELLDALLDYYESNKTRAYRTIKAHLHHVRAFFGNRRALSLTEQDGVNFVNAQRKINAAASSVNMRLAYLCVALRRGKFPVPKFERLDVDNARKGFFERAEFEAVVEHLPHQLKDVARFGYATGWRKQEILTLRWANIDLNGDEIRLDASKSKNKEARVIPIAGDLAEIIERRRKERALCPLVFHCHGRPIGGDFRRSWETACKKAGLSGKLFHDLRRSSIRNMVRAGVPEVVAMRVSGHRTRSVFDRYNIVSTDDLRAAMKRTGAYVAAQPVGRNVRALRP